MNPTKSTYMLVNSFPRSGSFFLYTALNKYDPIYQFEYKGEEYVDKFINTQIFSMPHIITNTNIQTISILRNPYDALASLIYMKSGQHNGGVLESYRDSDLQYWVNHYLEFTTNIEKMVTKNNFILVDFNKLIQKPVKTCEDIMKKFNMINVKNFQYTDEELYEKVRSHFEQYTDLKEFDGKLPRKKNALRNTINAIIEESKSIVEPAAKEYKRIVKLAI